MICSKKCLNIITTLICLTYLGLFVSGCDDNSNQSRRCDRNKTTKENRYAGAELYQRSVNYTIVNIEGHDYILARVTYDANISGMVHAASCVKCKNENRKVKYE